MLSVASVTIGLPLSMVLLSDYYSGCEARSVSLQTLVLRWLGVASSFGGVPTLSFDAKPLNVLEHVEPAPLCATYLSHAKPRAADITPKTMQLKAPISRQAR